MVRDKRRQMMVEVVQQHVVADAIPRGQVPPGQVPLGQANPHSPLTAVRGTDQPSPSPSPVDSILDLSGWNTVTDFGALAAAGVRAIIHKATEGIGFIDPFYHMRRTLAQATGLLWGAYHFGR